MAKKDEPKKGADRADADRSAADRAKHGTRGDAVRAAAAQAIEATAGQAGFTRERAQQLADELLHAAGRFREAIDELRPAGGDEVRALREHVAALERRVATLEAAAKKPAPRRRTTPAKPPTSS